MPDSVSYQPSPVTPLEWALYYMARGWSVVPVRRGEKMPAVPWARHQSAPANEAIIRAWFDTDATMGVGLVQGRHVGTVILDFDGEEGLATLAKLEARGLPVGIRQFTPRGGVHVMLTHPGVHVATRKSVLPGMDVRGDGGFVVAHPSYGANGRPYAWDADAHPDEAPLADVPDWLLPTITGPVHTETGQAEIIRAPATGPLGLPIERVTDGREQYMRDTILAVCRDLRDSLGRMPTPAELIEAAWPQYSARVDFTRPGRGRDEFEAKARYTLARIGQGLVKGFDASPIPDTAPDGTAFIPETGEPIIKPKPLWVDAGAWNPAEIPVRPWVVKGYLMRGSVTVLSGQGAGGKSSLVVRWSTALALGETVGEFRPPQPCRVINYNVEDDQEEQQRRYSAALTNMKRTPEDIAGKVIRCGPSTIGTLFERDPATGRVTPTKAMDALERLCMETGCEVLICDPLAELHNAEENDNTAMRAVIAAFRGMAKALDIAVMVLHHDRKGTNAPGDMDRMRGASAITGAVRVMLTLTTMSQEEADKFGIAPEDRRRHFRIDGAKSNYAIAQDAEWWKLTGHQIGNGEEIAACDPWSPPSPFGGLSVADCVAILDAIHAGTAAGLAWGATKQAGQDWAGNLLMADPYKRNERQAADIIGLWIKEKVLAIRDLEGPRRGHPRKAFVVNLETVAEMRRQKSGVSP